MTERAIARACVIGWPITQSRSPLIHGYWLKAYGIAGSYTKEAIAADHVETFLRTLETHGFVGCNVTVPHKIVAYHLAVLKDASAAAVGAANTLWLENGQLACANTDTYGFMTNLAVTAPTWSAYDGPVMVLGAGGSARAVVYGLLQAGRRDVRVYNRSLDRAQEIVRQFGAGVSAHAWAARNAHARDAALIVNTTTLGMNGVGDPAIDFAVAQPHCVAADLVYVPLETAFLRHAKRHGLHVVGGLGMLLHQAVPGFARWFGVTPEVTDNLVRLIARDIEAV